MEPTGDCYLNGCYCNRDEAAEEARAWGLLVRCGGGIPCACCYLDDQTSPANDTLKDPLELAAPSATPTSCAAAASMVASSSRASNGHFAPAAVHSSGGNAGADEARAACALTTTDSVTAAGGAGRLSDSRTAVTSSVAASAAGMGHVLSHAVIQGRVQDGSAFYGQAALNAAVDENKRTSMQTPQLPSPTFFPPEPRDQVQHVLTSQLLHQQPFSEQPALYLHQNVQQSASARQHPHLHEQQMQCLAHDQPPLLALQQLAEHHPRQGHHHAIDEEQHCRRSQRQLESHEARARELPESRLQMAVDELSQPLMSRLAADTFSFPSVEPHATADRSAHTKRGRTCCSGGSNAQKDLTPTKRNRCECPGSNGGQCSCEDSCNCVQAAVERAGRMIIELAAGVSRSSAGSSRCPCSMKAKNERIQDAIAALQEASEAVKAEALTSAMPVAKVSCCSQRSLSAEPDPSLLPTRTGGVAVVGASAAKRSSCNCCGGGGLEAEGGAPGNSGQLAGGLTGLKLVGQGQSAGSPRARRKFEAKERPFQCPLCDAAFLFKQNRDRHVIEVHEGNRPFHCKQPGCNSAFKNSSGLKQHENTVHMKARPFKCDLCNSSFGQRNHLTQHVAAVHEQKRPFACDSCGASFSNRGNLNQHVKRRHHGGDDSVHDVSTN